MSDDDKKVFISYRRALSSGFARSVYQHLTGKGYDAFMDVKSLDSGEFRRIILGQIKARPHFLALLTPGALVRTHNADDWLRQEIEHALELGRNVVPLLGDRFTFEEEQAKLPGGRFPGQLGRLPDMNAINVYWEYFDEAMGRLTKRFLRQPAHGPLVPTPAAERAVVQRLIENAARAQPGPGGRDWQWLSKTALSAPKLELAKDTPPGKRVWKWNPQLLATGYVLQRGRDESFADGKEVYQGEATEFTERSVWGLAPDYYRVRAVGGFGFLDSPWSNVVESAPLWGQLPLRPAAHVPEEPDPMIEPFSLGTRSALSRLAHVPSFRPSLFPIVAPELEWTAGKFGQRTWKWTARPAATRYVLQRSANAAFEKPEVLYEGDQTEFLEDFGLDFLAFFGKHFYRVRAEGSDVLSGSGWSEVVEA